VEFAPVVLFAPVVVFVPAAPLVPLLAPSAAEAAVDIAKAAVPPTAAKLKIKARFIP
jgi:hypothetical protein